MANVTKTETGFHIDELAPGESVMIPIDISDMSEEARQLLINSLKARCQVRNILEFGRCIQPLCMLKRTSMTPITALIAAVPLTMAFFIPYGGILSIVACASYIAYTKYSSKKFYKKMDALRDEAYAEVM